MCTKKRARAHACVCVCVCLCVCVCSRVQHYFKCTWNLNFKTSVQVTRFLTTCWVKEVEETTRKKITLNLYSFSRLFPGCIFSLKIDFPEVTTSGTGCTKHHQVLELASQRLLAALLGACTMLNQVGKKCTAISKLTKDGALFLLFFSFLPQIVHK